MEIRPVWLKYVTYSFYTYGYNTPLSILHIPFAIRIDESTYSPDAGEKEKRNG